MLTIKAPFNFVPLNDKVFFPEWADKISHDIPFEDGESGEIELKITAHSPIFVRNGHTRVDADAKNAEYTSFSKIGEKYFIPATSVKGAIRNVLEIMSFGKMTQISDDRYSLRDLSLKREYLNFFQNSEIHCGWMIKEDNCIKISDHGIPKRISHRDLDGLWHTKFTDIFRNGELLKNDSNRTALYKIKKAEGQEKRVRYDEFLMNSVNPVDKRVIARVSPAGKFAGTVVLTGQPSVRKDKIIENGNVIKKASGKCYEFVFPDITEQVTPYQFDIRDEIYKDFCFIYKDSEDWKYWKGKMERGDSVPVFFAVSKDKIIHFGLSYLYKLPYKRRIKNCLPASHLSARLDLSESIFGTTNPTSLKGRVQFSHAFMQKGEVAHELESYMGSPKSTYYPIYLEQPGKNGYMNDTFVTMMSDKARLKGWKRYPVREMAKGFEIPEGMKDENISLLTPIEKGAEFVCKIRFHNLRKVEIGALLSAISLNNNGYHSIGYAKSYGFGKVRIEQTLKTSLFTKEEYVRLFKEQMNKVIPNYNNENALKELFLMSFPQKTIIPLEYMQLEDFPEPKKQKKDKEGNFVKTGEYLPYYSELIKKETPPPDKIEEANAVVTLVEGPVIKAKLSNDATTYDLKVDGKRPKQWNNIKVRVIKKGGKIVSLILISISK